MTIALQRTRKSAKYFAQEIASGVTIDMVYVPGGEFLMGSPEYEEGRDESESPQHLVKVPAFLMGKYPVTQAQWRVVAGLPKENWDIESDPSRFKGDNLPVELVSWLEVMEFCARLSRKTERDYRLPSEAEWEYACRAGTTTLFHFGSTISFEVASYRATSAYEQGSTRKNREKPTPVGSFQVANNFGLYDMHGNVWELCQDHWHESYKASPIDGSAWIDPDASENAEKVVRGGSWMDDPQYCRSASRFKIDIRKLNIGFRVVFSAKILS